MARQRKLQKRSWTEALAAFCQDGHWMLLILLVPGIPGLEFFENGIENFFAWTGIAEIIDIPTMIVTSIAWFLALGRALWVLHKYRNPAYGRRPVAYPSFTSAQYPSANARNTPFPQNEPAREYWQ